MTDGIRLSAAIVFVRNLGRSVSFYTELLGLTVADRSDTAALLASEDGSELVLRATGENAPHALGQIGVQYVAWTVPTKADLDHRTGILRQHSAYLETRSEDGITVVEGRDPDDLVIVLVHPGESKTPMRKLPLRIYAW